MSKTYLIYLLFACILFVNFECALQKTETQQVEEVDPKTGKKKQVLYEDVTDPYKVLRD